MSDSKPFEVDELDDSSLENVSGGHEFSGLGCPTNSGNCVSGCACSPTSTKDAIAE